MILEVKDGAFAYDRAKVLENMNFSVRSGGILCVLGANGAGKTTLMKCLMGLERWTAGATLIDGTDIRAMKPAELWSRIAYVPQARPSAFAYTAREMVLLGRGARLGLLRQPGPRDEAIAMDCLRAVGVENLADRLLSRVSGGELQLILIARALAAEPELLALDEPESHLDFRNRLAVLSTVRRLRDERNLAFVMNTHFPEHALSLADTALLLSPDGARFGPTRETLTEEALGRAFGVEVRIVTVEAAGERRACVFPVDTR